MKLELKHYLDTKLIMKSPQGFRPNGKESTGVLGIVYLTADLYADIQNNTFNGEEFIPILRPLSDLTKEIELVTEDFNLKHTTYPKKISLLDYLNIAKTNPHKYRPRLNRFEYSLGNTTVSYNFDVNGQLLMPYDIVRLFYMNHFDVFGLIEKGLAIDINTLNK